MLCPNRRVSSLLPTGFVFSSEALMSSLPFLSLWLAEGRFFGAELAGVDAADFVVRRREEEEAKGRVGGLLRLVPGAVRDDVTGLDLEVGVGVDGTARLVIDDSRLGGIPFFGGDF